MPSPDTQRPFILQKCYFCGRGVKIRTTDALLLERLPNGRSYNFCKPHWNKLRAYGSPQEIEAHRKHLAVYRDSTITLGSILKGLQSNHHMQ